jgi:hypothetical protein
MIFWEKIDGFEEKLIRKEEGKETFSFTNEILVP